MFFETPIVDDYHDNIKITSEENFQFLIKVSALKPQPFINYPTFLDMGYCEVGKTKEGFLEFKNTGQESGKLSLKADKIKIEPNNFVV